jgi:asparagine synthetase B (glutamine-hydrolysing)
MCGIHFQILLSKNDNCRSCHEYFRQSNDNENVKRRGPDACHVISTSTSLEDYEISLQASVLQMRHELIIQPVPLADDDKSFLCWNGEVYQVLSENKQKSTTDDKQELPLEDVWNYNQSDTLYVANLLQEIQQQLQQHDEALNITTVSECMSRLINAEFAFLILTPAALYYGRDVWGRRSLLRRDCDICGSFQITSVVGTASVAVDDDKSWTPWTEVTPGQVVEYNFATKRQTQVEYPKRSFFSPSHELITSSPSPPPPQGVSNDIWNASLVFEEYLTRAVAMRLDDSKLPSAILFSGGLDSVVLAALAIKTGRPIVLSNVSFGPDYAKSADRQAALVSFETLKLLFPQHYICYEDIVVDWEDIVREEPHIRTLLQPKTTIMDINIATALWFASRGLENKVEDYGNKTTPRVILVGIGADEQLGGYGRHRKAFTQNGWGGLAQELKMDQSRLWERNLGRDDRICADHGKEARFPYLDPHVVQLLDKLPLEQVCDFSLPPGHGDKRILRLVALRLGLEHAGGLVKKAIQFGSRIAHVSDSKRFGSRRKAKGEAPAPTIK